MSPSSTLQRNDAPQHNDAPPIGANTVATIGGLPIAIIDRARSAELMIDVALARRQSRTRTPVYTSANGQVISMCARDDSTRELFLSADLIHADGMPLVFASRLLSGTPLPERVATTDLFHDVATLARRRGVSFYFLGGTPAVIEQAARRSRAQHPGLLLAGWRDGYFHRDQEAEIVAAINAARPDILWVGMGAPEELAFAMRNRERLDGVGLIKTSGGLFDFLSGRNARAPDWMQAIGFEWAYRIYQEPRRLFGRYLVTNPHALFLLATQTAPRSMATYRAADRSPR
jgi:exopolysaccharide biosynthesis WecB/TagA/CpsF family protein